MAVAPFREVSALSDGEEERYGRFKISEHADHRVRARGNQHPQDGPPTPRRGVLRVRLCACAAAASPVPARVLVPVPVVCVTSVAGVAVATALALALVGGSCAPCWSLDSSLPSGQSGQVPRAIAFWYSSAIASSPG